MADVTDKFKYLAPLWSGTVGTGGISDASVDSFALTSASGLIDGRIYNMTIDRVDSGGSKTLPKREVVTVKLSGSNAINVVRGVEGTAQAHAAGAVVEILSTADQWNDVIDGILVEHNQDGTHKEALVTTLKATGAVVTTGTSDVTIVTPKALKDAGIVAGGALTDYANLNLAEGQMINGKIVPSVSSNNLTVALKGMDGNAPSASNPVYVMIGGVLRTVTADLSVTKNAGTNYCNAGSSELATKEIDYFVYLGYNATDGVVIGFSRIPYGTRYDSFSATATAETYCAISTITNAAAADYYNVVGRFAATLSAGAGYTWSVPTYTATNLIQRPIYETRYLVGGITWNATTFDNGSGGQPTTNSCKYKVVGRRVIITGDFTGVKAGSNNYLSVTALPFSSAEYANSTLGLAYLGGNLSMGTFVSGGVNWIVSVADNAVLDFVRIRADYEI